MKAIVQQHYGDASTLTFEDVARPSCGDGDVLVQVVAAGVDRGALHFMTGQPYLMRLGTGLRTPKVTVPGVSFAGRVEAIGSQVTKFAVGDEVYGAARGTYAEYVAAAQTKVAPKPPSSASKRRRCCRTRPSPPCKQCVTTVGSSPANRCW